MGRKKIDLTGLPYGILVVLREYGRAKGGQVLWLCRCKCGKEIVVVGQSLRSGKTQSCGCLKRERSSELVSERRTTHGCSAEPWYPTYKDMMQRCGHWEGASECVLRLYRDRGITVCEEWQNSPRAFGDWLMAHGWHKGLQIDRADNTKGYSPDNCRVVTAKENNNNRRNTLRLDDGTPLASFCSSIGIETRECGAVTPKYARIHGMWKRRHEPHPELIQALKEDTDKQSQLLAKTTRRRKELEALVTVLKKFAQK